MTAIKLIVTDLDNTLLRKDKGISKYTAHIFKLCRNKGIKIVFATARPERATRKFQSIVPCDYIISNNGATINCGDKMIKNLLIPPAVVDEVMAKFLSSKEISLICLEDGKSLHTNYSGPPWEDGWNPVYTNFADGVYPDTPKISVECKDSEFLPKLIEPFPDLHMYFNNGEDWHQIMHKDAAKLNGIRHIVEMLGISLSEVIAFGDDYNDVEMLKACGIGVAVQNAIDQAKAAADYICESNDDDGVAKWLFERIINGFINDPVSVAFHKAKDVADELLKYAVIAARYEGKWIYCRHESRDTYEIPGGRREAGEQIGDTAKRELWEETGACVYSLEPVCVYSVIWDDKPSYGMLYFAEVHKLESLPAHSEIHEIAFLNSVPDKMTYPKIQPLLFERAQIWLEDKKIT